MRILIVNKFLYPNGGSETYIFKIGKCLKSMGHEVQYFGMAHEGNVVGNKADSYTEDMSFSAHGGFGAKIRKLTYPFKIIYSWDARRKIRRVLDDFQPDAVHLNNINFQITPSVIDEIVQYRKDTRRNVRIISTAHDYQWVCPNHMMMIPSSGSLCRECIDGKFGNCVKNRCIHNSRLQSILGQIEAQKYRKRHTYSFVDTVIAPSLFIAMQLDHNPDLTGRIALLHNFADMENDEETSKTDKESFAKKSEAEYEELFKDKSTQGNDSIKKLPSRYVIYFGRYDRQKGMDSLLLSCKALPEVSFVFAGRGEEYETQIAELPNVANVGFQSGDDLKELIAGALFSIIPSVWYENCPMSVIESQMYGTPVLASDLGGSAELISPGKTGELFRGGDAEDLTEHIRSLWNDAEKLERNRDNCKSLTWMQERDIGTLTDYCHTLEMIYAGETH